MRTFCLALLTGLALTGCDEPESPFTAATGIPGSTAEDADGDGYPAGQDCDDGSFVVNPAAAELCDGIDNDCDGAIDDEDDDTATASMQRFYRDEDGDGYGDAASSTLACAAPEGFIATAEDCDDAAAAVYPGAPEICDELDNDCDGDTDDDDSRLSPTSAGQYYIDNDGDGFGKSGTPRLLCVPTRLYAEVDGDCADQDPDTNPDAAEVCDGVDNDCDGDVDGADDSMDPETRGTFYVDSDGDGFGSPEDVVRSCGAPAGAVESAGDCDDADAAVHPEAAELCDGFDNDCDGATDDADTLADTAQLQTFYLDADGDGYGTGAQTTAACAAPGGYASTDDDCDDTLAAVHPGGEEVCDDIDNDCDGETDEPDAADAATFYADADGDGYGDPASTTAACEAPEGYLTSADDCDDDDAAVSPGAAEVCDDVDNDCDGAIDDSDADLTDGVTWYRDFDGDGFGYDDYNIIACAAPERYTETPGDCDDEDDTAWPGAWEQCDEVDNDCDGEVDQAWLSTDFEDEPAGLTATGDLSFSEDDDGGYLLLTEDADQVSALLFETLVSGEAWSISATVSMDDGEGNDAGVGGIAFAFLTETDAAVIGSDLGVSGLSGYAVELDIHEDDGDDPDGNHIAFIETDTMTSLASVTDIPALEGAGEVVVTVTVRDDTLEVTLDGSLILQEPLDSALSGEVMLGITASSGDPAAIQTLDDLTLSCP